ncbi:hypothetical protein STXM2123_2731 [Streptomyces sp. F-3]|nr:hypothetical protein STXM2123_2731 [Streptomyces sp. F-3]
MPRSQRRCGRRQPASQETGLSATRRRRPGRCPPCTPRRTAVPREHGGQGGCGGPCRRSC